jgi:putative ABC transport system ATP-binding protein
MRDDVAPILQGKNLTRTFGEGETKSVALNDVTLDIRPGQMTLLMGPSGSGKTTLMAVLSGLLHPDSGEVWARGQNLWAMSERERERFRLQYCGFIFQGYNLFGALTARQQLEMVVRWGEGASSREARRRADEMLERLRLTNQAHLRPGELSGGEKQRVAIGRALIKKDPAFCFADEPTSALDWGHGQQVVKLLCHAAHDLGAAVLCVAHDERICKFADRIFHLRDGRLQDPDDDEPAGHGLPGRFPTQAEVGSR